VTASSGAVRRAARALGLIGVCDEPTNQADTAVDGVVVEVAAQLLVAPAVQHFLDGLDLGWSSGTEPKKNTRPLLFDGQFGLPGRII
jgi:hypothetical protein